MFTHLHVHSEYSLLDGLGRVRELVARARELGMDSLALTDHGSLYGAIDFYLAAREAGIKPIIGCELYVASNGLEARSAADKYPHHLVVLARNEEGYRNLVQLVTRAHVDGFYYKPRVDKEFLAGHSAGIVALSACQSGEVARLAREGRFAEAERAARWYREVFGHFYLELQMHESEEQRAANAGLLEVSRRTGFPLVATNDVHYVLREDSFAHDVLLCIQTNSTIENPKRMRMPDDSFYLRSPQEMRELFAEVPQAVENTLAISEMCDLELRFERPPLPESVEIPEGLSPIEHLRRECHTRLGLRYPQVTQEIQARLDYELEVIEKTRFARYFLLVWDFVRFARERGILMGVRGSAAASIVLYCLGITDIDPLAHNLVFERFLNLEREEPPDIDMDFADDRRDEVIRYVAERYGQDRVAQIITFGTMGAKAAVRDVGRALGLTYAEVDSVAKLIPNVLGVTLERALEESAELRQLAEVDERVRQLLEIARRLEGVARHASTHAAGVVISSEPLTRYLPLQRPVKDSGEGVLMTQYDMGAVAQIGLLKMDFLGLANLAILSRACELIRRTRGIEIDLQGLPPDDARTFELLSAGETTGVFQLEGSGMRRHIKELRPSCIGDLAAMIALYRPGPMAQLPRFIDAKAGRAPTEYIHPDLEPILRETYGIIVYQDQVLLIVQKVAGYSLGQADIFRKAMGKKIPEKMREQRSAFVARAVERGYSEADATRIFDLIEPFAGYAFNKAHSACYAMVAYQTAYLKANYPAEYMAALLTSHIGDSDKIASTVADCYRAGLLILPPDINESEHGFTIPQREERRAEPREIRFGLGAIKNVGEGAIQAVVAARAKGGSFRDLEDFCRRIDAHLVSKRVLECLARAGAMDRFGSRGAILAALDRIYAQAQRQQRLRELGQSTMFDMLGQEVPVPGPTLELGEEDVGLSQKLAWEKELMGTYVSEHPLRAIADRFGSALITSCGQTSPEMEGQTVTLAGMVTSTRIFNTKDGRQALSVLLEELDGQLEVTVWPRVFEATSGLWAENQVLVVTGKVRLRNERLHLVCEGARPVEGYVPAQPAPTLGASSPGKKSEGPSPAQGAVERSAERERVVEIHFPRSGDTKADTQRMRTLFSALRSEPGPNPVLILVANEDGLVKIDGPNPISYSPALREKLAALVGEERVCLRQLEPLAS